MKKQISPVVIGVINDKNKYLLTKRRSPKREWNKWQFPGGGLEFGENIEDCLKREIKEETGLEINIVKFIPKVFQIYKKQYNFHGLFFVYLCTPSHNQKVILNNEASDFGWFTYKEILKLESLEGTKEMINFILNNCG